MIRGRFPCRNALTLLELMVVSGIFAILIALLVPAVQKAYAAAARVKCQNNLRQLGVALMGYSSVYNQLPPAGRGYNCGKPVDDQAPPRDDPAINLNGLVLLLPYIEQGNLYNLWDQKHACSFVYLYNGSASWPLLGGGVSAANIQLAQTLVPTYVCPADFGNNKTPQAANHIGNYGVTATEWGYETSYDFCANRPGGEYSNYWRYLQERKPKETYIFGENSTTRLTDIQDGTSNTIAMGETTFNVLLDHGEGWNAWSYRGWSSAGIDPSAGINVWISYGQAQPVVGTLGDWGHVGSLHVGGANVVMADGSVHFLSQSTDRDVLGQAATMAGGEIASLP